MNQQTVANVLVEEPTPAFENQTCLANASALDSAANYIWTAGLPPDRQTYWMNVETDMRNKAAYYRQRAATSVADGNKDFGQ